MLAQDSAGQRISLLKDYSNHVITSKFCDPIPEKPSSMTLVPSTPASNTSGVSHRCLYEWHGTEGNMAAFHPDAAISGRQEQRQSNLVHRRKSLYDMAEPSGLAAGLVPLAYASSVVLYEAVDSFNSPLQRVRDLSKESNALSNELGLLAEIARYSAAPVLSMLEIPLWQCSKACEEFEQELQESLLKSGGNHASFRNWARLRYMGEDVDSFRRILSRYKLTIAIALIGARLFHSVPITAKRVKSYNELVVSARAGIQDHHEKLNRRIELASHGDMPGSGVDADEVRLIKQEHQSMEKCLQICDQVYRHIKVIGMNSLSSAGFDTSSNPSSN